MKKIEPVKGWVLLSREELSEGRIGDWHIAWLEPFSKKKTALAFAKENGWGNPYKAVRGELRVLP